jgi:hypothetical protein
MDQVTSGGAKLDLLESSPSSSSPKKKRPRRQTSRT